MVGALDKVGEAWKPIHDGRAGIRAQPEDIEAFASVIETLCRKAKMAQQCERNRRLRRELCCGRLAYASAFAGTVEAVVGGTVGQR